MLSSDKQDCDMSQDHGCLLLTVADKGKFLKGGFVVFLVLGKADRTS